MGGREDGLMKRVERPDVEICLCVCANRQNGTRSPSASDSNLFPNHIYSAKFAFSAHWSGGSYPFVGGVLTGKEVRPEFIIAVQEICSHLSCNQNHNHVCTVGGHAGTWSTQNECCRQLRP